MKSLEDRVEDTATRCTSIEIIYDNKQWSCRFHHKSGIVCYGLGDTLEVAFDLAAAHGKSRATELRMKGWVF